MDPNACNGCSFENIGGEIKDTADIEYLMEQLERHDMGLPVFLSGLDSIYLTHLKKIRDNVLREKE